MVLIPYRFKRMKGPALAAALALALLGAAATPAAQAHSWAADFGIYGGYKALDDSDWRILENQGEFGLHVDFRPPRWPVSLLIRDRVAVSAETEADIDYTLVVTELAVGPCLSADLGRLRPYLTAGPALVYASLAVDGAGESDFTVGYVYGGGVNLRIGHRFVLGVDASVTSADVKLGGPAVDAGGAHVGITAALRY